MSLQAQAADGDTRPADANEILHQWFLDLLREHGDREVSRIIDANHSKLWKLKKAHQRLAAAELVLLHQVLDAPLPDLTGSGDGTPHETPAPVSSADPKKLFDFAYDRVCELEARKPAALQANEFQKLEQVFHILKTVQTTPDALELKDL